MTTWSSMLRFGFAAALGGLAAVGTLKLTEADRADPLAVGEEYSSDHRAAQESASSSPSGVSEAEVRALRRRVERIEAQEQRAFREGSEEEFLEEEQNEGSADEVTPHHGSWEQEMRQVHQEFDRQARLHAAEPVNATWQRRMEALVSEQATSRARELGVEFDSAACRSTSCIVEFTAPNELVRERSQGPLAATTFGDGCARFIVVFPDTDSEAPQRMRMIVDCSES